MESSSELSGFIQIPFSMMELVSCSLVFMARLQDRSVNQGEVVALVMVHGWLVLVDADSITDFERQKVLLLAKDLSLYWPDHWIALYSSVV